MESCVGSAPWLVGGDFNVTAYAYESSNFVEDVSHCSMDMEEIQGCMGELGLDDHPFTGPLFTSSNKQECSYLARKLDRVLTNSAWNTVFPDSYVEFQAPGISDHSPGVVWLTKEAPVHRPKPFKFFNFWTTHPEFENVVRRSWDEPVEGNSMQVLFCKLKRLKSRLKDLNREHYADISKQVAVKRSQLESQQLLRTFELMM
ncbi:hypothetical protein GQ457_05G018140 [Hibiscus cannabinus]